jgi:hypothetical protein
MPLSYYDHINESDRRYREAMSMGSQNLLEAIHWARKGYNPGTSEEPLKLPPDWSDRQRRAEEGQLRAGPRPSNDEVREMMEREMTAGQISRQLQINVQKITWIMKAIKLELRPDRQANMIRSGLWG